MSAALLAVDGVSKRFGQTQALSDLSLEFHAGQIHALCGHNGAGKSTLVKMLAGIEQPDTGSLVIEGAAVRFRGARDAERAGVAYVQQELSVLPTLSVEENVLLRGDRDTLLSRPRRDRGYVLELLERVGLHGVDVRRQAATLSAGEQQLVEIARAVGREARLLILDEPTATLSDVETARVFQVVRRLAEGDAAIVFVSHRLGEVLDLCQQVSVMRDGKVVASSPTSAMSHDALVHLMVGPIATVSTVEVSVLPAGAPTVLSVTGLDVPGRVADFTITARAGEIVALAGQVGAGASDALRALAGLEPASTGVVRLHDRQVDPKTPRAALRQRFQYVSNDRKSEGLFLRHSAAANLIATRLASVARAGVLSPGMMSAAVSTLSGRVGFDRRRLGQSTESFSGGNQQKLFVGRVLERPRSGLILLDEPTRGVDVRGRVEIHGLIRAAAKQGNAVIFASTELDEILDLAHTVVIMRGGRVVDRRPCSELDSHEILRGITHSDARSEAGTGATT